jgi:hypothetical protein
MHTTFGKIMRTIGIELLKSSVLVVTTTILSAALRKASTSAGESIAQGVRFVRNKVVDLKERKAA